MDVAVVVMSVHSSGIRIISNDIYDFEFTLFRDSSCKTISLETMDCSFSWRILLVVASIIVDLNNKLNII